MKESKRTAKNKSREQILKVAERLFAQYGFSATTTREIANGAGVNPALAFYYFGNKENLYAAVFEQAWRSSGWEETRRRRFEEGLPDEVLVARLAADILSQLSHTDATLRLCLFASLQGGPQSQRLSERFFRTHVNESYELMAAYVRKRIREGAFRKVHPLIAARGFFGLIAYQHVIQEFLGGKHVSSFSQKQVSRVLADLWLQGVRKHPPVKQTKNRNGAV